MYERWLSGSGERVFEIREALVTRSMNPEALVWYRRVRCILSHRWELDSASFKGIGNQRLWSLEPEALGGKGIVNEN